MEIDTHYESWNSSRNSGCRWEELGNVLIDTHCWELMKSVDTNGSLPLLFVMKVMIWHFVSDHYKVMTTLIVMLASNSCFGDFSAIHRYLFTLTLPFPISLTAFLHLLESCQVQGLHAILNWDTVTCINAWELCPVKPHRELVRSCLVFSIVMFLMLLS